MTPNSYLEPIAINSSRLLWRLQLSVHLLLAALLLWALLPWLLFAWYYSIWLVSSWVIIFISGYLLRQKRAALNGVLSFGQAGWQWKDADEVTHLALTDDVLVWPGLVILPFRANRRRKTLVLLSDSLAHEDLRRLRVWLRTVLPRT